ncbi:MAG: zinc-ribbon domain-containing protein [Planctomycetes bacterium]|nr:zinc-ribbon domain-containing protein [Planctomycetota bacterium]
MPLATDCPHCLKEFTLPDHLFGKRIKCKSCGGVFRVGGASAPPTADDFDALDAVNQTQVDAPAMEDIGAPTRAMPGRRGDDFATQPPAANDEFATQWGGQPDDFATEDMHADDFQTAVPPTGAVDFSETVLPAAGSLGEDTVGDTWGDTAAGDTQDGHFADSSDTAHDLQDDTAVDYIDPTTGDTVADYLPDDSSDTAVDYIPSDEEIAAAQAEAGGFVEDVVEDVEVEDVAVEDVEVTSDAPKLPGKGAKLPGKGAKLPGKGSLPGKGAKLPGKASLPGKGDLPKGTAKIDKGVSPPKGKKLPAKAGKPGEIGAAKEKKKGGGLLVKALLLFLLLDLVVFALLIYVPQVRDGVGLAGTPWLNDIASTVGGHVDGADTPAPPDNTTPPDDNPPDDPPTPPDDPPTPPDDPPTPPPDDPPLPPPDDPPLPPPDDPPMPPPDDPPMPPPDDPPALPPDDPPALPDPDPQPDTEPGPDPFESKWPKYERPKPKPAEPGRASDFFDEDFDNPRYEWDWLPSGVKYVKGVPGVPGALEVSAGKMFHMSGNVAAAEVRLEIWRDMDAPDLKVTGGKAKGYEVHFRFIDLANYHALQIRGDGYYRIVRVSGGQTKTLVGDSSGDYLPIPQWDRDSLYDTVVLTYQGDSVAASFNGRRLATTAKGTAGAGKVGIRSTNGLKFAVEKFSVDEVEGE